MNVMGRKLVFGVKHNDDGIVQKLKSRLVVKNLQQNLRINNFSPAVKATTIRIVITLVVCFGRKIHHIEIKDVFLNGDLQEEVYMTQHEGLEHPKKLSHVCKLIKALCGMQLAPTTWFDKLRTTLLTRGFINSIFDTCLFVLQNDNVTVYLLIYIDYILIIGTNMEYIRDLIDNMNLHFSLKNLWKLPIS